jgi:hypothetical protein
MAMPNNIQLNVDKSICDGAGCCNEATITIEEEVGEMGIIILRLCNDCIAKFREE